jgi:hypothetical protein
MKMGVVQLSLSGVFTHAPDEHAAPAPQTPHVPPQPSLPQDLPLQLGVQVTQSISSATSPVAPATVSTTTVGVESDVAKKETDDVDVSVQNFLSHVVASFDSSKSAVPSGADASVTVTLTGSVATNA